MCYPINRYKQLVLHYFTLLAYVVVWKFQVHKLVDFIWRQLYPNDRGNIKLTILIPQIFCWPSANCSWVYLTSYIAFSKYFWIANQCLMKATAAPTVKNKTANPLFELLDLMLSTLKLTIVMNILGQCLLKDCFFFSGCFTSPMTHKTCLYSAILQEETMDSSDAAFSSRTER